LTELVAHHVISTTGLRRVGLGKKFANIPVQKKKIDLQRFVRASYLTRTFIMGEDAFSLSYSRQQGAKQHHHFMVYVGWGTTTAVCYYCSQLQPTNNNKQSSG
jgi:hypothetical protein